MTGALLAAVAGVGFGLFQTVNRRAVRDMDVYQSTFLLLLVSAVILVGASVATQDVGLLWRASAGAIAAFAIAGLIHFLVGWTLLNASQKRIGAARTSPLLATNPLFGAIAAAAALGEQPTGLTVIGVALMVVGVWAVGAGRNVATPATAVSAPRPTLPSREQAASADGPRGWSASAFALGTAVAWAISPIFIRKGLEGLDAPLLGVTVSMVTAVIAYGAALGVRRLLGFRAAPFPREALGWKLTAGILVGVSTWTRWYALDLAPVTAVLALGLLSVPTVIALAPLVVGKHLERVTSALLVGSGLIVVGALMLITRS